MDARTIIAALAGAPAARLLAATWRFEVVLGSYAPAAPGGDLELAVYATWHQDLMPLSVFHRGRGIAALISLHRDGEVLSQVLRRLGYLPVRGSSRRGGSEGLEAMIEAGRSGRSLAFTPDGPRGPARQCKPGVVWAAASTGIPIVPVAAAPGRGWRLDSWDRFRIPAPGARVYVSYGRPLHVPDTVREEDLRKWTDRVGSAIDAEVVRSENAAGRAAGLVDGQFRAEAQERSGEDVSARGGSDGESDDEPAAPHVSMPPRAGPG